MSSYEDRYSALIDQHFAGMSLHGGFVTLSWGRDRSSEQWKGDPLEGLNLEAFEKTVAFMENLPTGVKFDMRVFLRGEPGVCVHACIAGCALMANRPKSAAAAIEKYSSTGNGANKTAQMLGFKGFDDPRFRRLYNGRWMYDYARTSSNNVKAAIHYLKKEFIEPLRQREAAKQAA